MKRFLNWSIFIYRLSGEDYAKLKKELRERKKILKTKPRLQLKQAGENASLNTHSQNADRIPLFLSDIQHLLLYSLLGHHSPYAPTRWCQLEKYNKVNKKIEKNNIMNLIIYLFLWIIL